MMKLYRFTLIGNGGSHTFKYHRFSSDDQACTAAKSYVSESQYALVHIHRHRNNDTCGIVDFVATYPDSRI